jgi:hypothetical protein
MFTCGLCNSQQNWKKEGRQIISECDKLKFMIKHQQFKIKFLQKLEKIQLEEFSYTFYLQVSYKETPNIKKNRRYNLATGKAIQNGNKCGNL